MCVCPARPAYILRATWMTGSSSSAVNMRSLGLHASSVTPRSSLPTSSSNYRRVLFASSKNSTLNFCKMLHIDPPSLSFLPFFLPELWTALQQESLQRWLGTLKRCYRHWMIWLSTLSSPILSWSMKRSSVFSVHSSNVRTSSKRRWEWVVWLISMQKENLSYTDDVSHLDDAMQDVFVFFCVCVCGGEKVVKTLGS